MRTAPRDSRIVFIDVARVLATLMMLFGHTVDALLSAHYRQTTAFDVWTFLRGLTPTTFTFVSGFALSLVSLHISTRESAEVAAYRRLRRFAFFLVLGYLAHYPWKNFAGLRAYTAADLQMFTAVDVLQCIAITLIVLQVLALRVRRVGPFIAIAAALAIFFCWLTPLAWTHTVGLPLVVSAYFNPSTGSIFPLFPWFAYPALGAAAGAWYLKTEGDSPGERARKTLLPLGVALLAGAWLMRTMHWEPFGAVSLGSGRPSQFLLQVGLDCVLLTLLAAIIDLRPARIPVVEQLAGESLMIYYVHLGLVYGSPWNKGFRQYFGTSLSLSQLALAVLFVWVTMIALGLWWSRFKRDQPRAAVRVRAITLGVMFVMLFV